MSHSKVGVPMVGQGGRFVRGAPKSLREPLGPKLKDRIIFWGDPENKDWAVVWHGTDCSGDDEGNWTTVWANFKVYRTVTSWKAVYWLGYQPDHQRMAAGNEWRALAKYHPEMAERLRLGIIEWVELFGWLPPTVEGTAKARHEAEYKALFG